MFSRFATPLNIVQFAQAHYKCKKGEFCHDGEEMESSASISSMNTRERYSGSNEDSSDKINCSSDDQSDRRERGYDDIDGTSSNFGGRFYVFIPLASCDQFTPGS